MSASVKELTGQLLVLPKRSRALIADLLLDSLDEGSGGQNERAWIETAKKRDKAMDAGTVTGRTHKQVMAAARGALQCGK